MSDFPNMDAVKAKARKRKPGSSNRIQRAERVGWINQTQTDNRAEPRNNVYNALLALQDDAKLVTLLSFDSMLRAAILDIPPPSKVIES